MKQDKGKIKTVKWVQTYSERITGAYGTQISADVGRSGLNRIRIQTSKMGGSGSGFWSDWIEYSSECVQLPVLSEHMFEKKTYNSHLHNVFFNVEMDSFSEG
jgi:hypothetical protein